MFNNLFSVILNMSVVASYVIVIVLVIKVFLKKVPKIFSYVLWAVVLFRLLCPFTLESELGLFTSNTDLVRNVLVNKIQSEGDIYITGENYFVNNMPITSTDAIEQSIRIVEIGVIIWLIGIVIMLIYSIIQLMKLKNKLIGATPLKGNIYIADHIKSPFVIGFLFPKIYLPSNISDSEQDYIVAHEKHHIKRFDHITRILGFIALMLHWFNPLVWVAFILSGRDMEMSCDEAVMKNIKGDIRIEYSQSLLHFSSDKKIIMATHLAFGESDTKERVKNIIKYKKPTIWISSIAIIIVLCVAVGLGTNQIEAKTVQEGVYLMAVDEEQTTVFNSRIVLEDGRFTFTYDVLSSYGNFGKYEIKDGKLILETDDGLYKYIFKIEDNNLIFQSNGSSSVRLIDEKFGEGILDGSVFYLNNGRFDGSDEMIETRDIEDSSITKSEQLSYDQAVSLALKTQGDYYFYPSECFAEGHIILGYDDSDNEVTKIYTLTTMGNYGFVNDNFENVSGIGFGPAVVTLDKDNNVLIEFPLDGELNNESIKEMFPEEYHERIFAHSESDYESLKLQEHAYAQQYLDEIERDAKIGYTSDFERILLTELGVSVEVSNKVDDLARKQNGKYPYFIGTAEYIEGNTRVVYEMSYDKNSNEIRLKNYVYGTEEFIEEAIIDAKTGDLIDFKIQ